MFDYLYEWLRNLSFYLILVTAVMYVLPSNGYRKYIRFFTGLVLVFMMLTPVFRLFHAEQDIAEYFKEYDFEKEMNVVNIDENGNSDIQIEVEEIVIEP